MVRRLACGLSQATKSDAGFHQRRRERAYVAGQAIKLATTECGPRAFGMGDGLGQLRAVGTFAALHFGVLGSTRTPWEPAKLAYSCLLAFQASPERSCFRVETGSTGSVIHVIFLLVVETFFVEVVVLVVVVPHSPSRSALSNNLFSVADPVSAQFRHVAASALLWIASSYANAQTSAVTARSNSFRSSWVIAMFRFLSVRGGDEVRYSVDVGSVARLRVMQATIGMPGFSVGHGVRPSVKTRTILRLRAILQDFGDDLGHVGAPPPVSSMRRDRTGTVAWSGPCIARDDLDSVRMRNEFSTLRIMPRAKPRSSSDIEPDVSR